MRLFQILLVSLAYVIDLVDSFLILSFQTLLNPVFFEIFLSTNFLEAQEFLSVYINANILAVFGVFTLLSALFWINPMKPYLPHLKPHPKIALGLFIVMLENIWVLFSTLK